MHLLKKSLSGCAFCIKVGHYFQKSPIRMDRGFFFVEDGIQILQSTLQAARKRKMREGVKASCRWQLAAALPIRSAESLPFRQIARPKSSCADRNQQGTGRYAGNLCQIAKHMVSICKLHCAERRNFGNCLLSSKKWLTGGKSSSILFTVSGS